MTKNKQIASLVINAILVISVFSMSILCSLFPINQGLVEPVYGIHFFKFFTNLSNILMGFAALVMLINNIAAIKNQGKSISRPALIFYLIGTSAVGLTFATVCLFLGPTWQMSGKSYFDLFNTPDMFMFHLVNPLLAIFCFIFALTEWKIKIKEKILGFLPTFIYSIIYIFCVVVFKVWNDFYHFTFGGNMIATPFMVLAMYSLSFAVIFLISWAHNKKIINKNI